MKILMTLALLLGLNSCKEKSGGSSGTFINAVDPNSEQSLVRREVNETVMFKPETNFIAEIEIEDANDKFELTALSSIAHGKASYAPSDQKLIYELENHDMYSENDEYTDTIVAYFKYGSLIYEYKINLKFTVMAHNHNGGDKLEYHWMKQDTDVLKFEQVSFDKSTYVYRVSVLESSITSSDKTVVKGDLTVTDKAEFDECKVVEKDMGDGSKRWVECTNAFTWDLSKPAGVQTETIIIKVKDSANATDQVLIMVHFIE